MASRRLIEFLGLPEVEAQLAKRGPGRGGARGAITEAQIARDNPPPGRMTIETLCRAMIQEHASAVIVHIDGVEYELHLKQHKTYPPELRRILGGPAPYRTDHRLCRAPGTRGWDRICAEYLGHDGPHSFVLQTQRED